jgi:glutamate-ammonia-ligase adenylyltransferase
MIVRAALKYLGGESGFAVVALGKFGSGEMNIGSDLDLIFIADNPKAERLAGELIKFLSEYTSRGIVYEIDMRLRPDGSKGILVNNIKGYKNYYSKKAQPWEVQALLRARPVAGDPRLLRAFHELKTEVITQRGPAVQASEIKDMRRRIVKELAKEKDGFDLKLGPGGIEEIEFLVQYLQLKYAAEYRNLITHRTLTAIKRLFEYGVIDAAAKNQLTYAYSFLKTVDTIRRINEEAIVKPESELAGIIARFLEFGSSDDVASEIEATRRKIVKLADTYYK